VCVWNICWDWWWWYPKCEGCAGVHKVLHLSMLCKSPVRVPPHRPLPHLSPRVTAPPLQLAMPPCQWRHFLYVLQFTWPKASPAKNLCQGFYLNGIIFSCRLALSHLPPSFSTPWRCLNIFRSHLNCSFLFAPSVPILLVGVCFGWGFPS